MSLAARLMGLASRLFRRSQLDAELEEELRTHVQLRADDLERTGIARAEAERRARVEFGGHLKTMENVREGAGGAFLESLLQDLRFGLRMLRRSPSFSAVAILTLALTIGANAVVFAALNAFVLRPLDVPRAESLYSIHRIRDFSASQSYLDYLDIRDRNHSFEDLVAYNIVAAGLDTGGEPTRAWLLAVSGNYFDALGIRPYLGRVFHGSDEHGTNSAPYVVLSYDGWRSRFHEDKSVVGRVVQLNKHPFTILGVTPPGFRGTLLIFGPDIFIPMVNQEQVQGVNNLDARSNRWIFMTLGHLKPDVTPKQAADDVNAISAELERTYPKAHGHSPMTLSRPSLYGDFLGRPMRAFLTALMLLAGLILLAACANLGSLFAARAADRSRELAVRLALGAARSRIMRQLFTEALLISTIGGVVGLLWSLLLLRALSTWQPFPQFPLHVPIVPDVRVFAMALVLAVASGFLFGAVPVRQVLRTDPYLVIKSGPAGGVGRRIGARDVLLVAQIAICALLVTSSMVAVRGLVRTLHGNFGFEPRNAMVLGTVLDMAGYRGDAMPAFQRRMIDAMETIPGVDAVGIVDWVPLTTGDGPGALVFSDETTDLRPAHSVASPLIFSISPGYFRAEGTALRSGRNLDWHDDKNSPAVAVVNEEFGRRLFGSPSKAVGAFFKRRDGTRTQVVGVVEDGRYESVTESQKPAFFVSILQAPTSEMSLVVRSGGDPEALAAAMRSKLRELDPGLPFILQTRSRAMDVVLFPARIAAMALGVLGVMAAMLSITGIFGLSAYTVSRRLRELGIRIALGADGRKVIQAALARPVKLLALGSAAGLVLGILASSVLGSIVYQATPRDPLVLTGVVLVMLALGLVATWIPAHRALSVDPLILLREE